MMMVPEFYTSIVQEASYAAALSNRQFLSQGMLLPLAYPVSVHVYHKNETFKFSNGVYTITPNASFSFSRVPYL